MIAVDLGSSAVKVCTLAPFRSVTSVGGQGLSISSFAVVEDRSADAIAEATARRGTAEVAVSAPDPNALVRRIRMPVMTGAELAEQIRWEAEQHIPYAIEDVVLSYRRVAVVEGESAMEVLLAASQRNVMLEAIERVREAGLRPARWVPAELCAPEALARLMPPRDGVALVEVGAEAARVATFTGGELEASRSFAGGGEAITRALLERGLVADRAEAERVKRGSAPGQRAADPYRGHDLSAAISAVIVEAIDELAAEVARAVEFFAAVGDGIDELLLTGGSAGLEGLDAAIARRAARPVKAWRPRVDGLDPEHGLVAAAPIGLALGGCASLELDLPPTGWLRRLFGRRR